ncbi:MAG: TolC family protein [Cyclobacteriaceae bacterium]|nr:TolC family protein [Cyclobacteriaceae bacterium]MCX7637752.1 TolC family protein [Cyclobacteriaceae bacterium]MDW8331788.1 TolC family protein [Cyclobacteriaceae bacterium]
MRITHILTIVCIAGGSAVALSQGNNVFSLQQCIDYALKESVPMKNAALDERIAKARVNETIGIGLPQINGSVGLDHNQQLRRFFAIYDPNSPFFQNPIPGLEVGDVVAARNFFQLRSTGDASLRVNQLLFNGSYLVGLQAANAYKELAEKNAGQTREEVIASVTKAYYAVLINRERIKSFDVNIARVDSLLKSTRLMMQNGFAEQLEADRLAVTLNNLINERNQFLRLQDIIVERLKFQMNYPMDQPLQVSGTLTEEEVLVNLDSLLADWNYRDRPDYQVLLANKKLQTLNIRNNIAAGMPVLSAYANMGYSTQSPNIGGLFKSETPIDDNGQIGPDKWYPYSVFGISLSVPIFSGLQRTFKIQQEKLTLQKIENGERQLRSQIDMEIKEALNKYASSLETLKWQRENMELSEKIARVTKIKYSEGVGSNIEVVDAESSLRQSQVNYFNALFDTIIARIDLTKALGKINTSTNN